MNHHVKVLFTNEKVFEPVGYQQWRLREEVKEWCKTASKGKGWGDSPFSNKTGSRMIGVNFIFTELDQALLFKLTWGGSL